MKITVKWRAEASATQIAYLHMHLGQAYSALGWASRNTGVLKSTADALNRERRNLAEIIRSLEPAFVDRAGRGAPAAADPSNPNKWLYWLQEKEYRAAVAKEARAARRTTSTTAADAAST